MKKVLFLFDCSFENGGIEALANNIYDNIDCNDISIDFATFYSFDNQIVYDKLIANGNHVFAYNLVKRKDRLNTIKPLKELLKREKYDVVHLHSSAPTSWLVSSLVLKICGVRKILVHTHTTEPNTIKRTIGKIISLILLITSDYRCACSEAAWNWGYIGKINKKRNLVIKNGIDLNRYKIDNQKRIEMRQKCGFRDNEIIIGHVGRFSAEKNHKFLIDLISLLPENYKLLLVGSGELFDEINDYSKENKVIDRVYFSGNVTDSENWYQAMDLFLLPSFHEGISFVGIEAQACGLPVISSAGVPVEVKITENVNFAPVDDKFKWVELVEIMSQFTKENTTETIRLAGYDIRSTANIIKSIYLGD